MNRSMSSDWRTLLDNLRATEFADVSGTDLAVRAPVSDRLMTALVRTRIPDTAFVRDVDVRAGRDNEVTVRFRLTKPAFLPPLSIRLQIAQQPVLPDSPTLHLRIRSHGLVSLASVVTRFVPFLPPWVSLNGDLVVVDGHALAAQYAAADFLRLLTHLALTTDDGRFVVEARAALPPPR
jgi:hypothetical protein